MESRQDLDGDPVAYVAYHEPKPIDGVASVSACAEDEEDPSPHGSLPFTHARGKKKRSCEALVSIICQFLQKPANQQGFGCTDVSVNPINNGAAYEINFRKNNQPARFIIHPKGDSYVIQVTVSQRQSLIAAIQAAAQSSKNRTAKLYHIQSLRDFLACCEAFIQAKVPLEISPQQPEYQNYRNWLSSLPIEKRPTVVDLGETPAMPRPSAPPVYFGFTPSAIPMARPSAPPAELISEPSAPAKEDLFSAHI